MLSALLLWQSGEQPHGAGISDDLWLRVTDLPAAVADRGHGADLDVNVRVKDEVLPEDAGTWRREAGRRPAHPDPAGRLARLLSPGGPHVS